MYKIQFKNGCHGEIKIDAFRETFESDFSYWKMEQYEQHWSTAGKILKTGKAVCFITSLSHPATANFYRAWSCYPQNSELVFQEQILFLQQLEKPFSITAPHESVLPYERESDDGTPISEWRTKQ